MRRKIPSPMTTLVYSRVNAAWLFMFGGSPLQMSDAPMFYSKRADAVTEATSRGLLVTRGNVVCVDPAKCSHPADARKGVELHCARPTLFTECGSCGATLKTEDLAS